MSQFLTPVDGGQATVVTTTNTNRLNFYSDQAVKLQGLEFQPTQWRPEGRPIYKRLPGAAETYQIDFFEDKTKGWVYIPYGDGIFGPNSLEVVKSDDGKFVIIKGGAIVWEYGQIDLDPVILGCELVGLQSTRYLVGYQLLYDDAPYDAQFAVEDFSLAGYELDISSSTDEVVGWRYPAVNAFQTGDTFWKNTDDFFPSYAQPTETYLSWKSPKYSALSKITLRCPADSTFSAQATLSVKNNDSWDVCMEANVSSDSDGLYYEFNLNEPTFQEEWKVSWDSANMAISQVTVSGIVTLLKQPATGSSRYALVAYPENSIPEFTTNFNGEKVPLVLCALAYVDVDEMFTVIRIDDVRDIVYRDYKPVAEWLTRPQDEDLIDLFGQVSSYSTNWMAPSTSMVHEYSDLREESIQLSNSVILGS